MTETGMVRIDDGALTAVEIRAQVNRIQEVMRSVMQKDVHYGVIPGSQKPSLLKPGAEKLLVTFRIAPEPVVEDLSSSDAGRFRVSVKGVSILTGTYLGSGVGECSSDEEKYKWRATVCQEEWDQTPEDRRRLKWRRGQDGKGYSVKQIRMEPADVSNTILKMAKKRALVDLALTVTAASDIFTQDIEDLPEELQETMAANEKQPIIQPQQFSKDAESAMPATSQPRAPEASANGGVKYISDAQRKRFYAIWKSAGKDSETVKRFLKLQIGTDDSSKIPVEQYDSCCKWAQSALPGD